MITLKLGRFLSNLQKNCCFGLLGLGFFMATPSYAQDLAPLNYEPPNRGAPGTTQDAGSRPGCPETEIPFTALMPNTNWGETRSDRPQFWVYVPNGAAIVEWVVMDSQGAIVEEVEVEVETAPGILGLAWPEESPGLESGEFYQWQAYFLCSPDESEAYGSVQGSFMRREVAEDDIPDSSRDRLVWLAAEGLWFDVLSELIAQRQDNPDSEQLEADWRSLLSDPVVNLEILIDQPILSEEN